VTGSCEHGNEPSSSIKRENFFGAQSDRILTSEEGICSIKFINVDNIADPVAARSEARALSAPTLDHGFESRLRHGCLSASFCVVLSCVGRGLATS
jgi:hypothetical protein